VTSRRGITRRNYGKGHGYTLDGRKVPGVTTITGMTAKRALIDWAGNTTAAYAVDYWEELAALRVSQRLDRLRAARNEDRDTAAHRGTQVHALAARLIKGEEVEPPEEIAGHVEAYVDFLNRTQARAAHTELVVASRRWRYCGTLDLIADLCELELERERIEAARWLLEIKTSRSGVYMESALQLTGYRSAEVYVTGAAQDGVRLPEAPMDGLGITRAGVVHVRSDGWELRPVDTGPGPLEYFRRLRRLLAIEEATDKGREWIMPPVTPPADLTGIDPGW
jgi:hypothetical protein